MRFIWTDNGFVDANGVPMHIPERAEVCLPYVVSDMAPVTSPVDGTMITSRSQLRYELEKHGKRIQDPSESPTKGKIRNAAFAKKRGFTVSDEYRDYDSSTKQKAAENDR